MFTLEQVIPWGRSFDEYQRMFLLSQSDLRGRILGCGDGPAAFNADATRRGFQVTSCDPLYRLTGSDIRGRIDVTYDEVLEQLRQNYDAFVWKDIRDVEHLGRVRMQAMEIFLEDYERGKRAGRYLDASLPELPFHEKSFDVALCSHLLFLYSDHLSESFHRQSALEMCRVAKEVRIFPLMTLAGEKSRYIAPVSEELERSGYRVSIERVLYEFQRGGNEMMRISKTLN